MIDTAGLTARANAAWHSLGNGHAGGAGDAHAWDTLGLDETDRQELAALVGRVVDDVTPAWLDIEAHTLMARRWARCHVWPVGEGTAALAIIPLREPRNTTVPRDTVEHIERILEHTADAIAIVDHNLSIRYASGTTTRFLGASGTRFEGENALAIVFAEDHDLVIDTFAQCIAQPRLAVKARFRLVHDDGDVVWVEGIGTNMFDDPAINGILISLHDISELVAARTAIERSRAALEAEKQRYEALAQFTPTGVFEMTTDGRITYCNEGFRSITGLDESSTDGWRLIQAGDREGLASALARARSGTPAQVTVQLTTNGAEPRWVTIRAVRPAGGRILASIEDSTFQVARQNELTHRAGHDHLTGLPNRRHLLDILDQLGAKREPIALMFIDLDNFKDINDGLGHQFGDRVLIEVAHRIKSVVRPEDLVGRLHGDEFLVICRQTTDDVAATEIAARVVEAISHPLDAGAQGLLVSASIGITMGNQAAQPIQPHPDRLIVDADVAMCEAKRLGGSRSVVFTKHLAKRASDRLRLHGEMQRAASLDELEVHYQPIVCLETLEVARTEALVRWHHPTEGYILPERFIPDIERSDLIDELGLWVVNRVLADIAEADGEHVPVHVNVSPHQLADGSFALLTLDALDRHGVACDRLTLEITEMVDLNEFDPFEAQLIELQRHGVGVAVDDFGTGYSALAYLRRFPFDQIKIDGLFVEGIDQDSNDRAIVASIVDLAASLGAQAIAEKVERQSQLDTLIELGCGFAQGYFLGKPVPKPSAHAT